MYFLAYKNPGETPLACLDRLRVWANIPTSVPLTYAGRLDPLAEGLLVVLGGEACKEKERFLNLNKAYECTVLLGFATDTQDVLGIPKQSTSEEALFALEKITEVLHSCLGEQSQTYPLYSSKTVGGVPLHTLARAGQISPEEIPTRLVTIYSIDFLDSAEIAEGELLTQILGKVNSVSGDFRQIEISSAWSELLSTESSKKYQLVNLRISASSGTYVRVLAEKIGALLGVPALAFHIRRTQIGDYTLAGLHGQAFSTIPKVPIVVE